LESAYWGYSEAATKDYDGPTVIQGRVLESGTNMPVAGAEVYCSSVESSGTPGLPNYNTVKSVLSDADGNYKITIEDDDDLFLLSLASIKNGFDVTKNIGVSPRNINNIDITLVPFGWLRVRVKNENKQINYVRISTELGPRQEEYEGNNVDTTFISYGRANKNIQIALLKNLNGVNWEYIEQSTVYVIGLDTTTINFNY
jgi:hypothetical protein